MPGKRIKACFAVVRRSSPFRGDPTPLFHPLQRWIESPVFDEQFLLGRLLDSAGNPLSVLGSKNERAEDQQIECALEQFEPFFFLLGRHFT